MKPDTYMHMADPDTVSAFTLEGKPEARIPKLLEALAWTIAILLAVALSADAQQAELRGDNPPAPAGIRELLKDPATWANVGARTADTAETCALLGASWRENWLPTQSCAGVVGINASYTFGSAWFELELKRHGHRRLARIPQWASFAGAAAGLIFTNIHTKFGGLNVPNVVHAQAYGGGK